ncbi:putative transcriptional regulator [Nocardia nova SH22a]|uniref:Transcriptional regulator WhiB n=3 Tax=Nocardia TaxID=1817 RepID=W5TV96_9NOCA|nr:putative transcriptional regulator [Nocardia nova SH22a]
MADELAPSGIPGGVSQTDSTTCAVPGDCADGRNDEREGDSTVTSEPGQLDRAPQGGQWARTQRKPEPPQLSLIVTDFDSMFDTIEEQWQERALCAQTDPEAFFPEKGGSTREAKRICLGCEVRDECLEYALAHDERFGIWGGLSERERRRLKRGIS